MTHAPSRAVAADTEAPPGEIDRWNMDVGHDASSLARALRALAGLQATRRASIPSVHLPGRSIYASDLRFIAKSTRRDAGHPAECACEMRWVGIAGGKRHLDDLDVRGA